MLNWLHVAALSAGCSYRLQMLTHADLLRCSELRHRLCACCQVGYVSFGVHASWSHL